MSKRLSIEVGKLTVVTDKRALVFTASKLSVSSQELQVTLCTKARTAVRTMVGGIVSLKDMVWTVSCSCLVVDDKVYVGAFEVMVSDSGALPLNTAVKVEVNDMVVRYMDGDQMIGEYTSSFSSGGCTVINPARA